MNPPSSIDLITERARVVRIESHTAWVHCESQAGCARCAAGEGCGGGLFAKLLGRRLQELPLDIPPDMKGELAVTDWVLVGLSTRAVQTASLLLYGLPLATLLLGAVAGSMVAANDLAAFLGAAGGLALGLLLARRASHRLAGDAALEPVLLRRLTEHEPCPAMPERRQ